VGWICKEVVKDYVSVNLVFFWFISDTLTVWTNIDSIFRGGRAYCRNLILYSSFCGFKERYKFFNIYSPIEKNKVCMWYRRLKKRDRIPFLRSGECLNKFGVRSVFESYGCYGWPRAGYNRDRRILLINSDIPLDKRIRIRRFRMYLCQFGYSGKITYLQRINLCKKYCEESCFKL
jgi:hypothetical protein